MRGYRVHRWGTDPTWEEIADPEPGPAEVAIDVEACGVGLTVLNCINGDLDDGLATLPRVPGHELVGRVTAVGPDAPAELVGRRVVAYFYLICGTCPACRAGREPLCANLAGWVGVHRDGGYAPRTVLPANNVVAVDDEIDPVAATVIPDAVATPVHVAGRAQIGGADRVVVIGAGGGVGVHMVQVARHRGADVAGLDIGTVKLAAIERHGATGADSADFADVDADALFRSGRPTVVVDLLGTTQSTRWGLDALDLGGRLIVLTTFRDRPQIFESRDLVFREASVLGSRYATRAELAIAAELVAGGHVVPEIGATASATEVLDIHRQLRAGTLIGRGALDWSIA